VLLRAAIYIATGESAPKTALLVREGKDGQSLPPAPITRKLQTRGW
jgi:hypothetical protein